MAVLIDDDFTRANSTSSPGSPLVGGPYTASVGTWGINGNQLYTPVSTAQATLDFPAAFNLDVAVDVANIGGTATGVGLMFRKVDASNFWAFWKTGSSVISLVRSTAGTQYTLWPTFTIVNGDRIQVRAVGDAIFCYINGKLRIAERDWFTSASATATVASLRSTSNTTARYDNLHAEDLTSIPGDASPAAILTDTFGSALPGVHVYKGRDRRTYDEGSVA